MATHYGETDMKGWISVNDQLPAIGQSIILFANGVVQKETHFLDAADNSDCVEYFWVNNHRDCTEDSFEINNDDMWQPLPCSPDI